MITRFGVNGIAQINPKYKGSIVKTIPAGFCLCYIHIISSFPLQHPCFEAAQLTLTYNKHLTNFFCIYRRPTSKKNNFTDSMFFDQFSDVLEQADSLPGKTLLMGDFNFYFENLEKKQLQKTARHHRHSQPYSIRY